MKNYINFKAVLFTPKASEDTLQYLDIDCEGC